MTKGRTMIVEGLDLVTPIKRYTNFLFWFIHNEIAGPLLFFFIIILAIVISPFYAVWSYFRRYYCRINK